MPHASLEATYLAYLDALNDRRFSDLDEFVQDELTYNDKVLTRQEYADMIAADIRAVPDLRFDAHLLLTDDDVVACRLWFDCTPHRHVLRPGADRAAHLVRRARLLLVPGRAHRAGLVTHRPRGGRDPAHGVTSTALAEQGTPGGPSRCVGAFVGVGRMGTHEVLSPGRAQWRRHLPTACGQMPNSAATCWFDFPSARPNTVRHR